MDDIGETRICVKNITLMMWSSNLTYHGLIRKMKQDRLELARFQPVLKLEELYTSFLNHTCPVRISNETL